MRKWVTMLLLGLLLLSGFQTVQAEATQTTNRDQSTCQDCSCINVNVLLNNLTANITNLTHTVGQKKLELETLYEEWSAAKNTSVLFEIVKLKDEIRLLTNELKYLERQKLSLQLVQNYTLQTPYGRKVLYYKLPSEGTIVQEHIKKVHPVRTEVDLEWFIAYYRQAAELTFTEVVQTDMRMRELLKKVKAGNYTEETLREIFTLLDRREKLWSEIYMFAEEKEKLQTLQALKETGRKQTLIASATGIEPLAINFGGINTGVPCSSCPSPLPPLPGVGDPKYASNAPLVRYTYFSPVTVWVGIYLSTTPDVDNFWGQYCTYEFPQTSTDVKKYWDRAVELTAPYLGQYFYERGSIQVKLFYEGQAYNLVSYQESNLIWQFDCNKTGCWVINYRLKLLHNPSASYFNKYYKLYVNTAWLACCKNGDVGSTCKWANRHCGGCFAQDAAATQNFVICTKEEYGDQCGWDWITKFS
ncbi:hypothetical protein [Thermococcus thioreducens]|uniref:Uncharacterized protein n=1 Tax=Thermococcus thioreducens TaxID=277988 RepID=A0A0Q2S4F1_9EURY|nr:hypothetical protein [Thermococcus thioreducens]ASJ12865.1 hypothetical protein A3L14_08195 [Thermococcus thioreducens]KQH82331.1 hypothetical protein AMR53_06955 [Thermococcus thioreducens]SEV84113.1 hypothetical protein SAMN05216170_0306 [Thermococcus thioreducens]